MTAPRRLPEMKSPPVRDPAAPIAIAHRAGNSRQALQLAIESGVFWIETDLWWHYGRIVARHERSLWRLPLLYDDWRLRLHLGAPLTLKEILRETPDDLELFLDLKGMELRLPRDVIATVRDAGALDRVALCGQYWPALDAAARAEPRLRIFYSFGSARHLRQLRTRAPTLPAISGASVAEGLLTPAAIDEFSIRGIRVFAWTVNDPARARELLRSGVAGIISDRLDLLADLRRPASSARDAI